MISLVRAVIIGACLIYFVAAITIIPDTSTTQSAPKRITLHINGLKKTINYTVQDTEVADLLEQISKSNNTTISNNNVVQLPKGEIEEITKTEDAELVENDNKQHIRVQINETMSLENISQENYAENTTMMDGQTAAILAGCFLLLSVVAYIGFLTWRRFLEIRYGNRQMLINEDEFVNPDDLKYFSI